MITAVRRLAVRTSSTAAAALVLVACLVLSTVPASPASGAGRDDLRLSLEAPLRGAVGEPLEVRLGVDGDLGRLGGYEAELRFDGDAAQVSDVDTAAGAQMGALGPVPHGDGLTLGAFTCERDGCLGGEDLRAAAADGVLDTVTLTPTRPGRLEVSLEEPVAVDVEGRDAALRVVRDHVTVVVGGDDRPTRRSARPQRDVVEPAGVGAGADVTGDGDVGVADVAAAALDWTREREVDPERRRVPPTVDVDGDRTLDVRDVQRIAAALDAEVPADLGEPAERRGVEGPPLTVVVDDHGDENDADIGDGRCATAAGVCTLRAAILETNAHHGPDTIAFDLPTREPIRLQRHLPALGDATGGTVVDGFTQPGAAPNDDAVLDDAARVVQIRGTGESGADAFAFTSAGNVVRGVATYDVRVSFRLYGADAVDNVVAGNVIGTDAGATFRADTLAIGSSGVHLSKGASRNRIGGTSPADRNVIGGNAGSGVYLSDYGTDDNVVAGNLIGLAPRGDRAVPNLAHGVDVNLQVQGTVVGGDAAGAGNVISGNAWAGVEISHGNYTTGNAVTGNLIGTEPTGRRVTAATPNGDYGVQLEDNVHDNVVDGNVIAGQATGGIKLDDVAGTPVNRIEDNLIGVTRDGTPAGNGPAGVLVRNHAEGSRIGPGNTIAHHDDGVVILAGEDVDGHEITRNRIRDNARLGIDVYPTGPNPNDPGDTDSGANDRLNHPVITEATENAVRGTACAGCRVEAFLTDEPVGSRGQGATFLGAATTAVNGVFAVAVDAAVGEAVTTTATDARAGTSEFGPAVAVGPASGPAPVVPLVRDGFGREHRGSWGEAEVGGPYTTIGDAGAFAVTGGVGTMRLVAPASGVGVTLREQALGDVDLRVRVGSDKPSAGYRQAPVLVVRQAMIGTEYRAIAELSPTGAHLQLRAVKGSGSDTLLAASPALPAVPDAVDGPVWLRVQAQGSNPTTLRFKAWGDGSPEPSGWQLTATDRTAALQAPGAVGLRAHLASQARNAPVTYRFDELQVIAPGSGRHEDVDVPADVARDTFSRTVEDGWGRADAGGPYALQGAAGDFAVRSGTGTMRLPRPASGLGAYLATAPVRDVDVRVRASSDEPSAGYRQATLVVARSVRPGTEYRGLVEYSPDGAFLQIRRIVGGGREVAVSAWRRLADVPDAVDGPVWTRLEVTGAAPTRLRMKVWADGLPEPATWHLDTTDDDPALQQEGGVGVRGHLASQASNAPVTYRFDDLRAVEASAD